MSYIDFLIRILVCSALSGVIGIERQWRHRLAGMRTNILVALGAFLFVALSFDMKDSSTTRVAAQVVSGIGFLGAGVIIKDGFNVRGLNTAATLWCAAAIGTLTSAGCILEALIGTAFILLANIFLRNIANRFISVDSQAAESDYIYDIHVVCTEKAENHIRMVLMHIVHDENIILTNLESEDLPPTATSNKVEVIARVISSGKNHETMEKIVNSLSLEKGITSIGWEVSS